MSKADLFKAEYDRLIILFNDIDEKSYSLLMKSAYWSLLILLGLYICAINYRNNFAIHKTYIINYLDDIYYKRDNTKNFHVILIIVLQALALFIMVLSIGFFSRLEFSTNSNEGILLVIFTIIIIIYSISSALIFLFIPFKFKQAIYDYEIEGYNAILTLLYISIFQLSFCTLLYFKMPNFFLFNLISSLIVVALNLVEFIFISKGYAGYRLVYEENGKEPRELFPKRVE